MRPRAHVSSSVRLGLTRVDQAASRCEEDHVAKDQLPEPIRTRIETLLASRPTLLFMKGIRVMPQCGFSARVVQVLDGMGADYGTVNILSDAELREGLKVYADWPTFPQLYHKGELLGGCDIVVDMAAKGELAPALAR